MIKAYYRLTKPGIIRANVITAGAGFLFASLGNIDIEKLAATLTGTALLIACGSVLNNVMDRDLDKRMKRTKKRATVTGEISLKQATNFAQALGLLGVLILLLFTNLLTALIGVLAVISYVYVYGWAKRKTKFATEVGTIPGAASIVAGYTAVTGQLNTAAVCLFLVMVTWQVAHFLAITLFRAEEYKAAKISVMPLRIGYEATQRRIMLFILFYIFSLIVLAILGNVSMLLIFVLIASGMYWLYAALTDYKQKPAEKWGRKMFGYSLFILLIFCFMISVDYWLP